MKKILLTTAMTYAGANYETGLVEMPENAAKSAIKRKFGTLADGSTPVAEVPEGFQPLSYEDTFQRFGEGDASSEVFDSLKFYQPKIAAAREAKMSIEDYLEREKKANEQSGQQSELPEDLPMRHVFAKLGPDYASVEKIKSLSRDELIKVNGIAEGSADKIIAYFADKK